VSVHVKVWFEMMVLANPGVSLVTGSVSEARLSVMRRTLTALAELRLNMRSVSVIPPFLRVAVPPPVLSVLPLVPLM
jgi:hypothetical protein